MFVSFVAAVLLAPLTIAAEPTSRPFALALTVTDFDNTPESTERVKRFVSAHAEVAAVYIDSGVPWPEAFEGKPFHPNVQKEIATIKSHIGPKQKVFLGLNAGAFNRRDMAPYWGAEQGMPRPGRWAEKSLDDPEVIVAFSNYLERMIQTFHPDYLCYAFEINMMAGANPPLFDKLVTLAAQVYPRLKKAHPKVLTFPTMQRDFHVAPDDGTVKALRRLLPFSDAVAVSTYPHLRGFTATTLPEDWFSSLHNVAPDKPFIIAETGFPAGKYEGKWFNQPVTVAGTPQMQRDYLRRLLTDAHRLDAHLVTWFFPEDINAYLRRQLALVDDPTKKAELDTLLRGQDVEALRGLAAGCFNIGLSDDKHQPRPAMEEWDAWKRLPSKPVSDRPMSVNGTPGLADMIPPTPNRADEPFRKDFSVPAAVGFLDAAALSWHKERKCFACHSDYMYLTVRPLVSARTPVHQELRAALEHLAEHPRVKPGKIGVTEAVMVATVLASNDAITSGKLHPTTRKALDRMWTLQRDDGGFEWLKNAQPPSEIDDHYGVTMAAIGTGVAPEHYADTPQARAGLDKIRKYLEDGAKGTAQRGRKSFQAGHLRGFVVARGNRSDAATGVNSTSDPFVRPATSERLGKTRTWWHLLLEQRMDQRLTQQYR